MTPEEADYKRRRSLAAKLRYQQAPEREAYRHAKARCQNPRNTTYKNYGGRGITFEFESFEQFFKELGPRPAGLTLDRIDNNQGYKPGNVRWATMVVQQVNKRAKPTKSGHVGISAQLDGSFQVWHKSLYVGYRKTLEEAIKLKESL